MADPGERFKTTKDLTLAEKGPYVLLEFSVGSDRQVHTCANNVGRVSAYHERLWNGHNDCELLPKEG